MIPFDAEIQKQFNKVIAYSQDIPNPKTDQLFSDWANKKEWLYKVFNNQLIYEYPEIVKFSLDEKAKNRLRDTFIENIANEYSSDISDFLATNSLGFFNNKTCEEYVTFDGKKIPVGMHINRAIGKFWKKLSEDNIHWIQSEYSRILQQDNVSGRFCLSIHPLDFLSLSENTNNWRSCHALDGEYRSGNLSYMADEVTMIAYLKSETNEILPRFPEDVPWNSKKWRCLFFFDKNRDMMYAGRQYPFFNKNALNIVKWALGNLHFFDYVAFREWVHNCFRSDSYKIEDVEIYLDEPHIFCNGSCTPLNSWVKDAKESMHYNDLLYSSFYSPWTIDYGHRTLYYKRNAPPMTVGAPAYCCRCGTGHTYSSEYMLCGECAEEEEIDADWMGVCSRCGCSTVADNLHYLEYNDGGFCEECWNNVIDTCEKCGVEFDVEVDGRVHDADGRLLCAFCRGHI